MDCIKRIYDCAYKDVVTYAHEHEDCITRNYSDYVVFSKMVFGLNEMHKMIERSHHEGEHDTWHKALHGGNLKWLVYLRLKDEVQDGEMDIKAWEQAKMQGNHEVANAMKTLLASRIREADMLNKLYCSMPFTHGTAEEQAMWAREHTELLERHKMNVSFHGKA